MYYRISLEELLREQCATDRVGRDDFPNDRLRLSMGRWEQIGQRRLLAGPCPSLTGVKRPPGCDWLSTPSASMRTSMGLFTCRGSARRLFHFPWYKLPGSVPLLPKKHLKLNGTLFTNSDIRQHPMGIGCRLFLNRMTMRAQDQRAPSAQSVVNAP
ncbi:hypothetical protein SAMN05444172_3094 [Burkholderia sp. GAS332]|jgi:hypothetical protein|uniref:hypothetical protein n=1 Tax=Paraburkholderia sediminicola TaxID=458836 RepID=UPI00092A20FD|nr:hypothetical protein SAMN05444172_3094 [Burkholderia sp. GAS332]